MAIDTLEIANQLKDAGFTQQQAEATARVSRDFVQNEPATKRDLKELEAGTKRDLKEPELAMKHDLRGSRSSSKQGWTSCKLRRSSGSWAPVRRLPAS